jgi:lipoate-protein ligase B
MAELTYLDLGRRAYAPTLQLQRVLLRRVLAADEERASLVLVEHDPPVITLGRRASDAHVLAAPQRLAAEGIELHHTGRGGDVTYHGPGQLVAYPILRVDRHGRDVHRYIRDLEEVIIRVLAAFDVEGRRLTGLTGVWVGEAKVAAIGVAVKRWVSYHGVALNVCPNLSHFDLIVPCGIEDRTVTSLARILGRKVSVGEVKPLLVDRLTETFGFDAARPAEP